MLALLRKEWFLLKPALSRALFLGLPVFLVFFYSVGDQPGGANWGMVYGFSFVVLIYGYVFQVGYQEDKNGGFAFLRSLPLGIKEIVGAKFAVLLLLSGISLSLGMVLVLFFQLIGALPVTAFQEALLAALPAWASTLPVGSLLLWATIRFGQARAGLVLLVLFAAGISGLAVLAETRAPLLRQVLDSLVDISSWQLTAIMFGAALVITVLCFYGSVRALRRRDLV